MKPIRGATASLVALLSLGVAMLAVSPAAPSGGSGKTPLVASTSALTPCQQATQRVKQLEAKLARARQALRRASTVAELRAAQARYRRVKAQLAAARANRKRVCAGGSTNPTTPGSGPVANQPPSFPPQTVRTTSENQYSIVMGQPCLSSQTLKINISPGASDPDGDPLTYTWAASNGTISGSGLDGTWTRVVQNCAPQPGVVTITASDGKGGTAQYQRNYM